MFENIIAIKDAIKEAFKAAVSRYKFCRYMQAGGNPDDCPYF